MRPWILVLLVAVVAASGCSGGGGGPPEGNGDAEGRTFLMGVVPNPKGGAEATWDDIVGKFNDCVDGVLPRSQSDEAIAMIRGLDTLADVRTLSNVLRTG